MDIIKRFDECAEAKGISIAEASKKCGVCPETVAAARRRGNELRWGTIEMLCTGFGVSLQEFFSGKPITPASQ